MTTIKNVAVAGASGNLGPYILDALQAAKFDVTVLTREDSKATFPSSVKVVKVDYTSVEALTNALKGQDAVISTLSASVLATQQPLIEAAVAAGVKRFIPSEFGNDTLNEKNAALPVFAGKVATQEFLAKEVERNGGDGLSYTLVQTGPFLDWGAKMGFTIDIRGKVAKRLEGGKDVRFSSSTVGTIGKAVTSVLLHPEETKNRAVYVQDAAMTMAEMEEYAQVATGGKEGWTTQEVSVERWLREADEEMKNKHPDPWKSFAYYVWASLFGEGYGNQFQKLDNELLGIKEMSKEELQGVYNQVAKEL